jgi:hypothetical protein
MSEVSWLDYEMESVSKKDMFELYKLARERLSQTEKRLHDLEDAIADLADKNWGEPNWFLTSESDGNDAIIYRAIKNSEARK